MLAVAAVGAGCRGGAGPEWAAPPPVTEGPPFVELTRLDGPAPLAGDRVEGQAGDWLLRNERLAVVVAEASGDGPAGAVIHAAPARGRDQLHRFDPVGVLMPSGRPEIREMFHDAAADSSGRTLVVRGSAGEEGALSVETRITLRAGANTVHLATRVTNSGDRPAVIPGWGDRVEWGGAETLLPGDGPRRSAAREPAPFVAAAGPGAAYAWVVRDAGVTVSEDGGLLRRAGPELVLSPDESAVFERSLVVCAGSWAEAADLAWGLRGEPFGRVVVAAAGPDHGPVEGAVIEARDESGAPWARGETPASGVIALPLPPGRYELTVSHPRRRGRDRKKVTVDAGGLQRQTLRLSDPARVRLTASDERGRALAARWTVIDLDAGLGRGAGGDRGAVKDVLSRPEGEEVLLPPGRYRLGATHGPAYEAWSEEVELRENRPRDVGARLEALPLPAGWLAADLSAGAPDAGAAEGARRRALAADGFDIALGPAAAARAGAASSSPLIVPTDALGSGATELVHIPLGGDLGAFETAWNRWWERLESGEPVVAVADRSYVDLGGAAPGGTSLGEAVSAGRVQLTRGPFVEFTMNGGGLGSTVESAGGPVRGHVRVVAPRSVEVREILITVNNEVHAVYRVRGDDTVRFDEDFEILVAEPGFVVVRVDGFVAPDPGAAGAKSGGAEADSERPSQPLEPLAITNPIRLAISGRRR